MELDLKSLYYGLSDISKIENQTKKSCGSGCRIFSVKQSKMNFSRIVVGLSVICDSSIENTIPAANLLLKKKLLVSNLFPI